MKCLKKQLEVHLPNIVSYKLVIQQFKKSYSGPPVIDTRTLHAIENDKKSARKAFEMINEEIEKIVCEMP